MRKRTRGPFPTPTHAAQHWYELFHAMSAERDAAVERVVEALYERAMDERRTFSREPSKFSRRWRDEPYVPPFDGTSRPTNWRDQWRDEVRAALAVSGQEPPTERNEQT